MIEMECQRCGAKFLARLAKVNAGRKFCSRSCAQKARFEQDPQAREISRQNMQTLREREDVQQKLRDHLFGPTNPFRDPEVRVKAIRTHAAAGWPTLNGGNGRGPSKPQALLHSALGRGWLLEVAVPTQGCQRNDVPPSYKVDIAHSTSMVAIEVDGGSHRIKSQQERDQKKGQRNG